MIIMDKVITATVLALAVVLALGPLVIPALRRLKFGQTVRSDGPRAHLKKTGTPTMGGLMFLLGIGLATLVAVKPTPSLFMALGLTLTYGLIGFADDFIKIYWHRPLGLRAREKLLAQFILAGLMTWGAVHYGRGTALEIPFTTINFDLGPLYFVFEILFISFTANAVNLTDGLDGLASGVTVIAVLVYLVLTWGTNQTGLAAFSGAVAGGCLGFLFYNRYPARIFMGDTGSLALGAALAALAVLTRTELWLPLIGLIFVLEALSVIIQVISFRLTGKRIFRMSPLHHHFELVGWNEKKVVRVFWTVGILAAAVAVIAINFNGRW